MTGLALKRGCHDWRLAIVEPGKYWTDSSLLTAELMIIRMDSTE